MIKDEEHLIQLLSSVALLTLTFVLCITVLGSFNEVTIPTIIIKCAQVLAFPHMLIAGVFGILIFRDYLERLSED